MTSAATASRGRRKHGETRQIALPPAPSTEEHLDISALETWLWDAACAVRGAADAPKFKDFILPLVFFKRLSDVFDDVFAEKVAEFGDEAFAWEIIREDHEDAIARGRLVITGFFIPPEYNWRAIRNHPADGTLGQFITTAMREVARLNPSLQGVLDVKDFNERLSGQRTIDDERLAVLVEVISRHRLGLKNAEPDILGRAYEYLLRKFAEGQGQSAGEFYTPYEVAWLMAQLIDPRAGTDVYDPACGSAGLLIKTHLVFTQNHPTNHHPPKLYGQELNPTTYAMAKMNTFLHGILEAQLAIGDTFLRPGFGAPPGARGRGSLRRFDYVVANPMWNQDNYDDAFYENDPFNRFTFGTPPRSSADWGWVQHILASLEDSGQAAVVLDTGAVSRGSGSRSSNRERDIRKAIVEEDLIEGVVLLPDNLFYNTTAPGIILLLNRAKPAERRGEMILINASRHFVKRKPKNVLTNEGIAAVVEAYRAWETRPKLSRVVTLAEVRAADYNLSPSQFVDVNDRAEHRPLAEILADLAKARAERERADATLNAILASLGLIADREISSR
jgi:type I restriction enzyme M protein